jgi:UDP-GlcNAc:undecaprenyl-phosphate GlcNAc-1-phosphate transferase
MRDPAQKVSDSEKNPVILPAGQSDHVSPQDRTRLTTMRRIILLSCFLLILFLLFSPVEPWIKENIGRWFYIFLLSWLVGVFLVPISQLAAFSVNAVDWPDRRRIHDTPTPRLGGIAIFVGIVASLGANGILDPLILKLMVCTGGLFAVSLLDDIRGVSARLRLFVQIVLSIYLVQHGLILNLMPHHVLWGRLGDAALTVIWMVGITNAFNFFDGMDGLAAGLALLISGFLGAIAFNSHQPQLGWVSVAIMGATLGFLPFNWRAKKSAEVFMGDCGSTILGFILAGIAVHGEWAVGHPVLNITPPFLIFVVLIYDMIHTTASRIFRGDVRSFHEWIDYTGRDHLHHRFEALFKSKRFSVCMVFLLTFCLGLSAMIIRHVNLEIAALVLFQCVIVLVLVTILEHAGNLCERRKTFPFLRPRQKENAILAREQGELL